VRVGQTNDGIALYRFQYNWSEQTYVGVMAQEVLSVRPDAVSRGRDGYLRVNYDAIGVQFQTYSNWVATH
jgi:hypothetical protein